MSEEKRDKSKGKKAKEGGITLIPLGGIASRIRTMASAIHLAQAHGRNLEILWQVTDEFPCPYERLFTISPRLVSKGGGVKIRQMNWKDFVLNRPPEAGNFFLTWPFTIFRYDHTICLRKGNNNLNEQLQEIEELIAAKDERILLASEVPLGSFSRMYDYIEATVEVNNILRSRMSGWEGNVVGVHINRFEEEGNETDCPTELIIRRMQKMVNENREVRFFISTRSREEKERLAALFKERAFVPFSTQPPNSTKGIVENFGELLALSHTHHILSTKGSSFSEVAAEIGGIRLEILSVFTQNQLYY